MRLYALISRYYGFTPVTINGMTLYQFKGYLDEIVELEKTFKGNSAEASAEEILAEAGILGLKGPRG